MSMLMLEDQRISVRSRSILNALTCWQRLILPLLLAICLCFIAACGSDDETVPLAPGSTPPPRDLAQNEFDATRRGGASRHDAERLLPWVRALSTPSGWSVRVSVMKPIASGQKLSALVLVAPGGEVLAEATAQDVAKGSLEVELPSKISGTLTGKARWSDGHTWSRSIALPEQ